MATQSAFNQMIMKYINAINKYNTFRVFYIVESFKTFLAPRCNAYRTFPSIQCYLQVLTPPVNAT